MKRKQGRSENKVNKQREKTEQGTERRVEKNRRMAKIESRKENRKEQGADKNRSLNSIIKKYRKRGERKNRVTYSWCLHDPQDLCWGEYLKRQVMNHKNCKVKKQDGKPASITVLQITAGQRSMTVDKWVLTASIYDILIIVTADFFSLKLILFVIIRNCFKHRK